MPVFQMGIILIIALSCENAVDFAQVWSEIQPVFTIRDCKDTLNPCRALNLPSLNSDHPLVYYTNDDPNPAIREEVGHTVLAEKPAHTR